MDVTHLSVSHNQVTRRSIDLGGAELTWHTEHGTLEHAGRPCAAFGLHSSLVSMLAPLHDELSTELFRLLVAHHSSLDASETFRAVLEQNDFDIVRAFEVWSGVLAAAGWGRLELKSIDPHAGRARVVARNPWEMVMQHGRPRGWGCPSMLGSIVGAFRTGFGRECWASETCSQAGDEASAEFEINVSARTLQAELQRTRDELVRRRDAIARAEVARHAARLQASQESQRALLSSLSDLVFSVGAGGIFLDAYVPEHPGAGRFPTGIAAGSTLDEVFPRSIADLFHDRLARVLTDGSVHTLDYTMPIENVARSYSARLSPLRDAQRHIVGVTAAVRDITEHKQLQEDLVHARKLESMGLLVGCIAHEFNNQLTVILGHAELIRGALAPHRLDGDEILSDLGEIQRSGQRAIALTRQLLSFSRRDVTSLHNIDLDDTLGQLEKILGRLLRDDVELCLVRAWGLPCVRADQSQLEQVVLNLAINANDAMAEGGVLTLETGAVSLHGAEATARDLPPGRYVSLTVRDTGTGIAPELLERVFDPFFTTKPVGRGTGLGLATVHSIIKQSGGHIDVRSRLGEGTEFRVLLPAVAAIPDTPAEESRGETPGGSETVLVCEDEPGVRSFVRRALSVHGYTVLEAANPRAALALGRTLGSQLALLVTDVVMPTLNGPQLAAALRRDHPGAQVLYISGYTSDVLRRHRLLGPDVDLLRKPFDSATLLQRVRALLDGAGTRMMGS